MKYRFWRPISIDYISHEYFPDVALYMRTNSNFVMYKAPGRQFTVDDHRRLERNYTEFLYIRTGDMEEINDYLENNLAEMIAREDLNSVTKGRILYQTVTNYVIDVFENPEKVSNKERCSRLIHLMLQYQYMALGEDMLEALRTVTALNYYIFGHSVQVAALNLLMHENLFKLDLDEMVDVGIGSLFHDIGMTLITDGVLDKPDALCDFEFYKLKQHTQKGYEFLKQTGLFSGVALGIVRHHHDRYDGNGYPTGIMGGAIPVNAQATSLSDIYSALTTERPYRTASSSEHALKIMQDCIDIFNPELFKQFREIVISGSEYQRA